MFSDFWARVILIAGAIGGALAFWKGVKSNIEEAKENEIKAEQGQSVIDNVQKSKEAESEADNVTDVDGALRKNDWMRD